jgi:CRP-like cAMP-binding protein
MAAGWSMLGLARLVQRADGRQYQEAMGALRAVPLWTGVPEERLREAAKAMRSQTVAAGTEVIRQGDTGDRFYVVDQGAFEVLVDGQPVARLGRGDYFGGRALLQRTPRTATVVAAESGRVFWLDRASFQATLGHDLVTHSGLEAALGYRAEVAGMPLFRGLSAPQVDLLLSRLTPVSARAGNVIVRQGEPGDRFYVIRSGSVAVEQDGQRIGTLGPGEAFGEIALLLEIPRTATVRAMAPTDLLALDARDFQDVLVGYYGRAGDLARLGYRRLARRH